MGGEAKRFTRRVEKIGGSLAKATPLGGLGVSQAAEAVSDVKKAEKEAEKAAKRQEEGIARQEQQEKLRLAESEDEIARRKLLRRTGGRQSLIASR